MICFLVSIFPFRLHRHFNI